MCTNASINFQVILTNFLEKKINHIEFGDEKGRQRREITFCAVESLEWKVTCQDVYFWGILVT